MAADAGLYGLDFSARAVLWAEQPRLEVHRPGAAWRRLFRVALETGVVDEVGPPKQSVWEFDWDGDSTVVAIVSDAPSGYGWYHARLVALDLHDRSARALYEPTWHLEGLALSPDGRRAAVVEGYSSDPGLLSGSVMIMDLEDGSPADPWPGLESVGLASWIDAESLVVQPDRRPGHGHRPNLARRSARRGLEWPRVHRRQRGQADLRRR